MNGYFTMFEELINIENQELIKKLELFRDKAFCHHSHYKAGQIYREIKDEIPAPYDFHISVEWSHVQLGHGFKQACDALDFHVRACIKYLKGEVFSSED